MKAWGGAFDGITRVVLMGRQVSVEGARPNQDHCMYLVPILLKISYPTTPSFGTLHVHVICTEVGTESPATYANYALPGRFPGQCASMHPKPTSLVVNAPCRAPRILGLFRLRHY